MEISVLQINKIDHKDRYIIKNTATVPKYAVPENKHTSIFRVLGAIVIKASLNIHKFEISTSYII